MHIKHNIFYNSDLLNIINYYDNLNKLKFINIYTYFFIYSHVYIKCGYLKGVQLILSGVLCYVA